MTTYSIGEFTTNLTGLSLTITSGGTILADNITQSTALSLNGNSAGINLNTGSSGSVVFGNSLSISNPISIIGTQIISSARNVTNLTITDASNVVAASSLMTTGSSVAVSGSAPTAAGQQLITTSTSAATWQQTPVNYAGMPDYIYGSTSTATQSSYIAGVEIGLVFTLNKTTTVISLSFYHTSGLTSSSRTLRLWNSSGTLLTSGTTSGELTGWNSAPISSPITLAASTQYTLSFTSDGSSGFVPSVDAVTAFPGTTGTATLVANSTGGAGSFPTGTFNSFIPAIDINANTLQLGQAVASQALSNSSITNSFGLSQRILWAVLSPSGSTLTANVASYGFASFTYASVGHYTITYTNSFTYLPCIFMTLITSNATYYDIYAEVQTTSGTNVVIIDPLILFADFPFSIVIIGF